MNWYLTVVRDNYANFSGRARRSEYWYFTLFQFLILMPLLAFGFYQQWGMYLYVLYAAATFLPGIAVVVRRLHDINKSGWYYFVCLIPLIGGIWLLILLCTEGTQGPNQYGEDPKNNYDNMDEIGTAEAY